MNMISDSTLYTYLSLDDQLILSDSKTKIALLRN